MNHPFFYAFVFMAACFLAPIAQKFMADTYQALTKRQRRNKKAA